MVALSLAWRDPQGQRARTIVPSVIECLDALAAAVAGAEHRGVPEPILRTRRELGLALLDLLDGPGRVLSRRLELAALAGTHVALTIALRGPDELAEHPGVKWRWELLADQNGPLLTGRRLTIAVQLGDPRATRPRAHERVSPTSLRRVLERARRLPELQRLLRILRDGKEGRARRVGAVIVGNAGTGKSSLAARASERLAGSREAPGVITWHGRLDETRLFAALEQQARRWQDAEASALLRDGSRATMVERLGHLLAGHWSRRRLLFVLDEFESNFETRSDGLARPSGVATALLEVLLPACRTSVARLLVTTTARFELPTGEAEREPLAWIQLRGQASGKTPNELEQAVARIGEDARSFVRRARVYERPVPREALEGLCEGLAINLDRQLPELQDAGMIEASELDGELVLRVSHLVEPTFDAALPQRWHAVAAGFCAQPERHRGRLDHVMMAWEHALVGRCEALAATLSSPISAALDSAQLHRESLRLAQMHLAVFPEAEAGLAWAGHALSRSGEPLAGWEVFERAEASALARGASGRELVRISTQAARILAALGRLPEAAARLHHAVTLEETLGEGESESLAVLLGTLAKVLKAQGDLAGARERIERALAIKTRVFGTEEHPSIAASLHNLAQILVEESRIEEAIATYRRKLQIDVKCYGTRDHYLSAETEVSLAMLLVQAGRPEQAVPLLRHAIAVFTEQAPTHPLLAELRELFGRGP
jgi:tetratricopeptide (TPR) repeat protein